MKGIAMKKKVGIIEACAMDQNRAVGQVAAYTAYLEGLHRGKGPTIFELAFRHTDLVGSSRAFKAASNLILENRGALNLFQTKSLNGDLKTSSQKWKGNATSSISPQDSHCHDTVLITSPITRSRRNLLASDFADIPCCLLYTSPSPRD